MLLYPPLLWDCSCQCLIKFHVCKSNGQFIVLLSSRWQLTSIPAWKAFLTWLPGHQPLCWFPSCLTCCSFSAFFLQSSKLWSTFTKTEEEMHIREQLAVSATLCESCSSPSSPFHCQLQSSSCLGQNILGHPWLFFSPTPHPVYQQTLLIILILSKYILNLIASDHLRHFQLSVGYRHLS